MEVKRGDLVRVRVYRRRVVERRVVDVGDGVLLLSTPEECEQADKEKREPVCLGFPVCDVITDKKSN
jgi:hypothetical protein